MTISRTALAEVAELTRRYGGFKTEVWTRLQQLEMNMEMQAQQDAWWEHVNGYPSLQRALDRKNQSD